MAQLEVDNLKMLRETLCVAQKTIGVSGDYRTAEHVCRLQVLLNRIDIMRPLGSNGEHGNLHTEECGCE